MKSVNKVILVGRVGADPVRRETKGGAVLTQFSLATSRRFKSEGSDPQEEYLEETQWHRVVVWGREADLCSQYLHKGQSVYVEGQIRMRKYEDPEGQQRTFYEIHAREVNFLSFRKKDAVLETECCENPVANDATEPAVLAV